LIPQKLVDDFLVERNRADLWLHIYYIGINHVDFQKLVDDFLDERNHANLWLHIYHVGINTVDYHEKQ
jgi:hypothetical protein